MVLLTFYIFFLIKGTGGLEEFLPHLPHLGELNTRYSVKFGRFFTIKFFMMGKKGPFLCSWSPNMNVFQQFPHCWPIPENRKKYIGLRNTSNLASLIPQDSQELQFLSRKKTKRNFPSIQYQLCSPSQLYYISLSYLPGLSNYIGNSPFFLDCDDIHSMNQSNLTWRKTCRNSENLKRKRGN